MIRRILAGAAIAAVAFGFSASAASANDGPRPNNSGQAVLSQWQIIDDVLNDVANNSLNNLDVNIIQLADEIDLDVLNNNQPEVGDGNRNVGIRNNDTDIS
ncbi:hypothetical protein Nocox_40710 [Nonomuraea coxensis DSM 45129]|uniref:Secreted protein n=1 Tax=Nonomuraea coxensis DSM 45129 TaxID=1122611 RepID=A0ABX8UD27_9ACTN|nr:hypothetical protein [Nonomuraea coxensis]QYC45685.1 hypothetical protein Nocox_40710 [Nonomuraea coxensis DSM 45129]